MKKSQLRKIIKESIKELMTEQSNSTTYVVMGDIVAVAAAAGYGLTNPQDLPSPGINNTPNANPFYYLFGGSFNSIGMQQNVNGMSLSSNCGYAEVFNIDSQAFANEFNNKMSGEIGVYIEIASGVNNAYNSLQSVLGQMNADFTGPVYGCTYVGSSTPPPVPGCMDSTASNYDPTATVDDGSCITAAGGCDQSAWPNYSNWLNNFTSLPNFTSSNPNQPCQFLCQRDTQWSAQISTVGPNWANMLQCKLDEVQSLMQTHNCASSNASAC